MFSRIAVATMALVRANYCVCDDNVAESSYWRLLEYTDDDWTDLEGERIGLRVDDLRRDTTMSKSTTWPMAHPILEVITIPIRCLVHSTMLQCFDGSFSN